MLEKRKEKEQAKVEAGKTAAEKAEDKEKKEAAEKEEEIAKAKEERTDN